MYERMNDSAGKVTSIGRGRGQKSLDSKNYNADAMAAKSKALAHNGFNNNGSHLNGSNYTVAKSSKKLNYVSGLRPTIEIYRPPVLRRDQSIAKSSENLSTKPLPAVGSKQSLQFNSQPQTNPRSSVVRQKSFTSGQHFHKGGEFHRSVNIDSKHNSDHSSTFHKSAENLKAALADQKQRSLKHSTFDNRASFRKANNATIEREKPKESIDERICANSSVKRSGSFVKELSKKKVFGNKEIQEAKVHFDSLGLLCEDVVYKWIDSKFENQEFANPIGQVLIQQSVEHNKSSKTVAKLCAILLECPSTKEFQEGLVDCCAQYFDCRLKLKETNFGCWIAFMTTLSELYSAFGLTYEGNIVDILFRLYSYLLESNVLETIKIEELECLIASLLTVGYNLERQSPDKLAKFLVELRDAFISASEPWVRKMLLLIIELSASNWKLPEEANDYYFQTHSSRS